MSQGRSWGMTRRDFAKLGAAAGLTALLADPVKAAADRPLRVGLLGCGGRGSGAATQILIANDNVKLVAVADAFEDKLEGFCDKIMANKDPRLEGKIEFSRDRTFLGLDSYKGIIESDIDILIEGTLPYSRPKHVEAAVEAGKHIFTEKPAAVDPAGIRQFIAASEKAKEKNLCIVAGTQRRHSLDYQETIKKIHDGAIGDISSMRVYWNGSLPFAHDRKPEWSDLEYCIRNWYAHCWTCGDSIVEQHVHNIDIAQWVIGANPLSVYATGGRAWKPFEEKYGDLWDHFCCDFEYPNNVHVYSFCRHWENTDGKVSEEVFGTKGRSACNDMMDSPRDKMVNPYEQEHIDLVNSVRGVTPYINEGVQVAHSTLAAIMGRMSAYTGKVVKWEEALNSDLSIVPELDFEKPYPVGPIPVPGKKA